MGHFSIKILFGVTLLLFSFSLWMGDTLPRPQSILPAALPDPIQIESNAPPFEVSAGGIRYTVKPLYRYELTGLVVSQHDAGTWRDYIHKSWNDHLNITDLCVIWGTNAQKGIYQDFEFFNGQFTCNIQTHSQEAYAQFDPTQLSNNHLLATDPRIIRALHKVKVGDQIRLSGFLSEYSHHQGFPFHRGTSIVRTDMGNGACETIFVDHFTVLKARSSFWLILQWISFFGLLYSITAWFRLPPRLNIDDR